MSKQRSSALKREREHRKAEKHAAKARRREERKNTVQPGGDVTDLAASETADGQPLDSDAPIPQPQHASETGLTSMQPGVTERA